MTTRRRFLTILAGAALLPTLTSAAASWRGIALGAQARIILDHPQAEALIAQAVAEISRLESLFSLHRDSELTRLNRDGALANPAPEMLELLSIASGVNAATKGAFDPSIQPLWALYAERLSAGLRPDDREITAAYARTGWQGLRFSPAELRFERAGMALTLNGIAQGFIADKVAALFRAQGVENVLVNTGEIMALGVAPNGADWPVTLANTEGETVPLRDTAMATSAPLGTVFDEGGTLGHILDPRSGRPGGLWSQVSVIASSAALADGFSTAFCLMDAAEIAAARSDSVLDVIALA